jgi:hypothetical protein
LTPVIGICILFFRSRMIVFYSTHHVESKPHKNKMWVLLGERYEHAKLKAGVLWHSVPKASDMISWHNVIRVTTCVFLPRNEFTGFQRNCKNVTQVHFFLLLKKARSICFLCHALHCIIQFYLNYFT